MTLTGKTFDTAIPEPPSELPPDEFQALRDSTSDVLLPPQATSDILACFCIRGLPLQLPSARRTYLYATAR